MDRDRIVELLAAVADGSLSPDQAAERFASLPFAEAAPGADGQAQARIDHHRAIRTGFPEVVFCQGKTPDQVRHIAKEILEHGDVLLATRATAAHFQAVSRVDGDARFFEDARLIVVDRRANPPHRGHVVVATGGTADVPVAEEAAICAATMGLRVEKLYDVGVSGIHRLLAYRDTLDSADAIIAVAGMEGALPSLVAGLVSVPVIAVPTSVGYGAHFGGVAPLLTMLNSCASGIAVMNIDNGFGAAALAERIVRGVAEARGESASAEDAS